MQPQPLLPTRQEERIQLEVRALQRTRDRLEARLLPAAAGLDIPEDFIAANDACVFHDEAPATRFGPEHEGRVGVASPGDGDRSPRRVVLDETVLRKDAGGVRLCGLAAHQADDAV